jgi:hypothetical protein
MTTDALWMAALCAHGRRACRALRGSPAARTPVFAGYGVGNFRTASASTNAKKLALNRSRCAKLSMTPLIGC